ncbi:MAG: serine acetyltransferase [Bacteroidetes bacterium]|nr:serine acetyltransferase [Bacteroidota bacterium]
MKDSFVRKLYEAHSLPRKSPSPEHVCRVVDGILELLFPELADQKYPSLRSFQQQVKEVEFEFYELLNHIADMLPDAPESMEKHFMEQLPVIHEWLLEDARAISEGDPAATGITEVIRSYPGFFAIAIYRIAHVLHTLRVPLIPRILTEHAHSLTGIDIHPGARIGKRCCIDHGTGVVIGETVEMGEDVKIYQGVTLGALSVRKDLASTKRHPTICDRVILYSGATILGGETVIGSDSVIGGNVWITESIPPNSNVYYQPDNQYSLQKR